MKKVGVKFMIKLIASDMDGTLLNAQMQISKENADAIRYANSKGVEFMVATGRNRQEAIAALKDAGIDCAMINLNGALIYDKKGDLRFTMPISSVETDTILDYFDANQIYYEVCTNKGILSESQAQRIENFASMLANTLEHLTYKMAIAMASSNLKLLAINYVDSIRQELKQPDVQVLKIICFSSQGDKVLGKVAKNVNDIADVAVTSSGPFNVEINNKNAQKGIAVGYVAKSRGIEPKDIMTIGDSLNDASMIQLAGVSFAMGNAAMEIKEYAKYITDTNLENGVAKAIYRAIDEEL